MRYGVVAAATGLRWYAGLAKPAFAPPVWLAAAAGVALAALLAWAFFRILCRPDYLPDRPAGIRLFVIMLGLGAAWSWTFFAGRHPTLALAVATILVVAAITTAWRFAALDRHAGLMLLPCVLAALFTALLDLSITLKNG